jgi:ELWxxDGT repeat protein
VIFSAYDSTNGGELWVTDGTTEGTVLVKDIYTGSSNGSGNNAYPRSITVIDDLAYFWAADSQSGSKAWVTDGTSANTRLMTDGVSSSGIGAPSDSAASGGEFVKFGNRIYFRGNDSFNGSELWSTAIALEDAAIVADIWPGTSSGMQCSGSPMSCGGGSANDRRMLLLNGRLVFLANGGNIGFELWTMTLQPPGAPRDIAISATSNSATVSWSAPARVGSGITWYTVTSNPGAFTCVTATLTCSVAGLLSNQDYTFTVVASDATSDGSPAISSRIRTPSPQLGSLVDSLTSVSNIVSDSVLHPGDALNVLYSGFNPNELVLLLIASNPVVIGSANADVNGNVVFLTTIPAGPATGSHHLIVYAPVSGFGASQAVTVSIPTPVAGTTGAAAVVNPNVNPDTLPATGGGVIPFLIALTLLIAGFALLAGRSAVSQWVLVLGRRV